MRNWLLAALLICVAASPARSQSVSMAGSVSAGTTLSVSVANSAKAIAKTLPSAGLTHRRLVPSRSHK